MAGEQLSMRIVQLPRSAAAPYGSRRLLVLWDDGSATVEEILPGPSDSEAIRMLERTRGRRARAWRRA